MAHSSRWLRLATFTRVPPPPTRRNSSVKPICCAPSSATASPTAARSSFLVGKQTAQRSSRFAPKQFPSLVIIRRPRQVPRNPPNQFVSARPSTSKFILAPANSSNSRPPPAPYSAPVFPHLQTPRNPPSHPLGSTLPASSLLAHVPAQLLDRPRRRHPPSLEFGQLPHALQTSALRPSPVPHRAHRRLRP